MNIFKDEEDICGRYFPVELNKATEDFFNISRKIRQKLGGKSYKLDQYLGWVLEIANSKLAVDAAEDGRRYFSEFRGLCKAILDYEPEVKNHEFYQTAKRFIEDHRYPYKEKHTLLEIYFVLLTPQFTNYAVKKFIEDVKQALSQEIDTILVAQHSKLIVDLVGEDEMVALNRAITGRFIISSTLNSFLQAITNEYLYCLLHRDPETSKRVFQLIMEGEI